LYKGWRSIPDKTFDLALINWAYLPDSDPLITDDLIPTNEIEAAPNEFFIFEEKTAKKTKKHLTINRNGVLHLVPKEFPRLRISPKNIEQRMALSILSDPSVSLVTLIGKAGTGKTFLALAAALTQMNSGKYERILLTKPNIAMGNDIGYLPGSESDKMKPWMQSFFDNLDQLFPATAEDRGIFSNHHIEKGWEQLFYSDKIQVQPVYSVRGRSISNAYVIIDEAQNLTPHETKTLITRAAEGTKVVLCGDPYQVDRNFMDHHSTGLTYVTKRMRGAKEFGTVYCSIGVRSTLAELAATKL
jgi:PhoH-like ATPase